MKNKIQPNVIISLQLDDTTTHYLIGEDVGHNVDQELLALGVEEYILSMANPVVLAIMSMNGDGDSHFQIISPNGKELKYNLLSVLTIDEFKDAFHNKPRRLEKT